MNTAFPQPSHRIGLPRPSSLALVLWGSAGLLISVADGLQSWRATVGVLMVSIAFCGFVFLRRYRRVRHAVIPDFLTIFLLFQVVHDGVTFLGVLVNNNTAIPRSMAEILDDTPFVLDHYQAQAEIVFLAAIVVLVAVWQGLERGRILALWRSPPARAVWLGYIACCGAHFVLPRIGLNIGTLDELLKYFSIGALGILLGGSSRYALGKRRSLLVLLAASPLFLAAFKSGMKGEVLLIMLPVLLPMLRRLTPTRVAILGLVMVFIVLFLFPFSQVWRDANWAKNGRTPENISLVEAGQRVADKWQTDGVGHTSLVSTAQWLRRGSGAEAGGLVMQIAARDGFIGPVLIRGLTTVWVPRVVWPGKPSYIPGMWFTWYLGRADSPESAGTSTAMMLPTELYWMFGPLGVLFGMMVLAVIHFFVWTRLLRLGNGGAIPSLALFALLAEAIRLIGMHTIYAVSGPLILLFYVMALHYGPKYLRSLARRRRLA